MRKVQPHLMRKKDKPTQQDIEDCCDEIEKLRNSMSRICAALDAGNFEDALRIAREEG